MKALLTMVKNLIEEVNSIPDAAVDNKAMSGMDGDWVGDVYYRCSHGEHDPEIIDVAEGLIQYIEEARGEFYTPYVDTKWFKKEIAKYKTSFKG